MTALTGPFLLLLLLPLLSSVSCAPVRAYTTSGYHLWSRVRNAGAACSRWRTPLLLLLLLLLALLFRSMLGYVSVFLISCGLGWESSCLCEAATEAASVVVGQAGFPAQPVQPTPLAIALRASFVHIPELRSHAWGHPSECAMHRR